MAVARFAHDNARPAHCLTTPVSDAADTRPELPDHLSVDPRRPHHVAAVFEHDIGIRFNGKERQDVEEYCLLLRLFARPVADLPTLQVSRDPADDYVIATAIAAGVSYLVTRDKDLLTLKSYQTVHMIRPEEFIAAIRQQLLES